MVWAITNLKNKLLRIRSDLLWLSLGLAFAVAPHSLRIPLWMPVMFFSLAIWRLYAEVSVSRQGRKLSLLGRFSRQLMMLVIVVGVFNSYGTLVGRDAGVALLVLLAGMKLLELQSERDYYIGGFIGMFLILTNFLYSQTILAAVHMLMAITIIVTAMLSLNDRNNFFSTKKRIQLAGSMLFQSIPILLILFVLFPRIDGPLWGLPKDALSGTSGLDDEMTPGQISQLSLSNEVAFRVEFADTTPSNSSLYWRGPVLWYTDGVKWVGNKRRVDPVTVSFQGKPVKYIVTMEATDKNWLYALEMASAAPEQSFFSHDLQILTRRVVRSRRRFELSSFTDFTISSVDEAELAQALQLPQGYHPKATALAESWRDDGKNAREIVNAALNMFNQEEFYYTLQPPLLLEDNVDQFIFESRQGFCEHYAASFVILMRAGGVPARVVTGYQGGSVNPIGEYLVVRQRDAHAWAEVWLDEEGWVRIDPTAAVAPERILEGIENALPESLIEIPLGLQNSKIALDAWRRISYRLDAINNRWNQWILGYNNSRQTHFLNYIGFGNIDWRGMTSWLLILITLVLISVAFVLFRNNKAQTDEARILYDRFCRKLARCGITRHLNEGPRDFAHRATRLRRDLSEAIDSITNLYVGSRYQNRKDLLRLLRQQINMFKPARHGEV